MKLSNPHEVAKLVGGGTVVIPTGTLPTPAEVKALEARLGVHFPDDYREFLLGCGSLLVEVKEELWERPHLGSIGPHWMQTRYELSVFGFCEEVEWLRLEVEAERFRAENSDEALVPVMGFANTRDRICFRPDGSLVEWTRDGTRPLRETFAAALKRLLLEQKGYKDELLAG